MYNIKYDKYRNSRGGYSRILDVKCEHRSSHVCFYQKDGPGSLRRMYFDRMIDLQSNDDFLLCKKCKRTLAMKINYEKENRPAYRLFVESVSKSIVNKNSL